MKDQCIHLLQYDQWANLKLLDHLDQMQENIFNKTLDGVFPTIAETFYHIYRANRIWFKRCLPDLALDESITEFHSIDHAKNSFSNQHGLLIEAVNRHFGELGEIVYQNQMGTTFKNEFDEVIHHLANHGTYHRGNIASMIRQCGVKGTSTDYIQFLRDVPRS